MKVVFEMVLYMYL